MALVGDDRRKLDHFGRQRSDDLDRPPAETNAVERCVGRPQVGISPPVFLPGGDLEQVGVKLRLLAERDPQDIAPTKAKLLPLGLRHEVRELLLLDSLLVKLIGTLQLRVGVLHFSPHRVKHEFEPTVELQ